MVFSTFPYILFLIVTVLLYWRVPQRFRMLLLLLASGFFYMCWDPPFGIIYAPVIFLDSLYFYWLSRAMIRWPAYKKSILVFGIVTELCLLAYFKYADFLAGTVEWLLKTLHLPAPHWEFHIFLPLAISFTNFVLISYLVDVYRGEETPDPSFTRFATYVAFFPHLIAGPIVRASELLRQLSRAPQLNWDRIREGVDRFLVGFFIKACVADTLAPYVDLIFRHPELQGFDTNWVAIYAFAVQIFCDFAGYTLMAQGSALMMDLTLPENFDAPYFVTNIRDFWRRWHMSLSRWLRDYLYIPLGGSRGSPWQTARNLFITMGLGGLWHGANWTFVFWGLYQGLLLSAHKLGDVLKIGGRSLNSSIPAVAGMLLTFHCVCVGWVFFRAQGFPEALTFLQGMLQPWRWADLWGNPAIPGGKKALVLVLAFFAGHAFIRYVLPGLRQRLSQPAIRAWTQSAAYFLLIYLGLTLEARSQAFIYFQF